MSEINEQIEFSVHFLPALHRYSIMPAPFTTVPLSLPTYSTESTIYSKAPM